MGGSLARRVLTDARLTTLAVVILVVVPLVGFRMLTLRQIEDSVRAQKAAELSDAAAAIASDQQGSLVRLRDRLRAVWSGAPDASFQGPDATASTLDRIRRHGGRDVVGVALADQTGRIVASDPAGFAEAIADPALRPAERGQDVSVGPFADFGGRTFSVLSIPVDRPGDPVVLVGVGVVSALRDARALLGSFRTVDLVDQRGTTLSVARYMRSADATGTLGADLLACCTGTSIDPTQLRGEATLSGGAWRIVVSRPLTDVHADIDAFNRALLGSGSIAVALLLIATILLTRAYRRTYLQRDRLREVQEAARIAGWSWDLRRSRLSGPVAALHMLGLPDLAGGTVDSLMDRIHPADRQRVRTTVARAVEEREALQLHCRVIAGDGSTRVIELRAAGETDPGGAWIGLRGTAQDVTENYRREEQRALLLAEIDSIDEAIVVTTLDGAITEWNAGAERLFGWSRAEAFESPIAMLRPPELREGPAGSKLATIRAGRSVGRTDGQRVRKDGSIVEVAAKATPVRNKAGEVVAASWTYWDLSRQRALEAEIAERASHDALTGLPNRFLLRDRLDQALKAGQRAGSSLALLEVDVERFGEVNDAIGQQGGDALLMDTAAHLRAEVRSIDTVARIGTDIFAVVIPGADDDAAALVASRLRMALGTPFRYGQQEVDVAVSVGVAIAPAHGDDSGTLLHHCEVALSAAKRSQSGYALYARDFESDTPSRVIVLTELRHAVERNELVLEYQPEVDVRSGELTRVEALVRWAHSTRGTVAPLDFIPIVEDSGLVGPLTRWVLSAATAQCRAWRDAGFSIPVAVNISARSLLDPGLVADVTGALASAGIPGDLLTIEITEGVLMADAERAREVLGGLRALGVHITIDDFGTGYSSFAYLDTLPLEELKIDRSFVMGLDRERGPAIVGTMIDLGHHLGLEVVAEGVEDDAVATRLMALGCDTLQGYWVGRPMPAADLERWLGERPAWIAPRAARTKPRRRSARGRAPAA